MPVSRRILVALLTVVMWAGASTAHAQYATHVVTDRELQQKTARPANILQTQISTDFDGIRFVDALEAIAQKSGAKITITDGASRINKRVTLRSDRILAQKAFEHVLKNTPVEMRTENSGRLTFAIGASVTNQVVGTILGRIVHAKTRQPITGATVTVQGDTLKAVTGSDGRFRLSVPAGERTVQIRAVGFVRTSRQVGLDDDKTTEIEIALEPSASVLDEVIVTGTVVATERKAIPTPITVIRAEELEQRGITRIEQLFRGEIPGVFAEDKGIQAYEGVHTSTFAGIGDMVSSNVFVRGSSNLNNWGVPTPLKTYIDGVELLDPSYLGTIDPQSIERIEIVAGPQAATIYGSGAMGGVMQIFTKKGSATARPEITLSLRYGTLKNSFSEGLTPTHTHSANFSGVLGPQWTYASTLTYNYSGQWQPGLFSERSGGSLGLSYRQGRFQVDGSGSMTLGRNGMNRGGVQGGPVYFERVRTGVWAERSSSTSLSYQKAKNASQTFSANASYAIGLWRHGVTVGRSQNNFVKNPESPFFEQPTDSLYKSERMVGARTTLGYNVTAAPEMIPLFRPVLTAGVNGSMSNRTRLNGCHPTFSTNPILPCNSTARALENLVRVQDENNVGIFGTARLGWFDRVFMTLGVRGESGSNYGDRRSIDWKPTNGIAYTEEIGKLTVKTMASYGRATRQPPPDYKELQLSTPRADVTPAQYIEVLANPYLEPEYSQGPQFGMELYFSNRATLSVNRYRQEVRNLIARVTVDSIELTVLSTNNISSRQVDQYINIGTVRSHGWESVSSVTLGPVSLRGTYSWNDSRIQHAVATVGSGRYQDGQSFLGLPSHTGNFTVAYAKGPTNVSVVTNWIGRANYSSTDGILYADALRCRVCTYTDRRSLGSYSRPGYAKSDISVSHRMHKDISATLHVINVGNRFTSDKNLFSPALGRQASAGIRIRR